MQIVQDVDKMIEYKLSWYANVCEVKKKRKFQKSFQNDTTNRSRPRLTLKTIEKLLKAYKLSDVITLDRKNAKLNLQILLLDDEVHWLVNVPTDYED